MNTEPFQEKRYRNLVANTGLVSFRVVVKETDLMVQASKPLQKLVRESILTHREAIEAYILENRDFLEAMHPLPLPAVAPPIVRQMIKAGQLAGVGPMAAVAGAVAEFVGRDALKNTDEVIIENGGDIFMRIPDEVTVGVYAGLSELSGRIGIRLPAASEPVSLCTSSGTVGHSTSFGNADAVCVLSDSGALADASATAVGNRVKTDKDIPGAIEFGQSIPGVKGIMIIIGSEIGLWGGIEVVPLRQKKVEFLNEKE